MEEVKLIGFTGPMGAGKSEAARAVKAAFDCSILSFATPLKEAAKLIFMLTDGQIYTMEGKQAVDPRWGISPREILQRLGTEAMRKEFPGVWVKHMEIQLKLRESDLVVIDDVRFEDEVALIRSLGGKIVHIRGRAADKDITLGQKKHQSESKVMYLPGDLEVYNQRTLEFFQKEIVRRLKNG